MASCVIKSSPKCVKFPVDVKFPASIKFPVESRFKYVVERLVKCIPKCFVKFYGVGCAATKGQFVGGQFERSKMF